MVALSSPPVLESPANPRIKEAARLRESRERRRRGRMLLEGRRELTRALEAGVAPEAAFVLAGHEADPLVARLRAAGAEVVRVGARAFEKLCYRERPELPVVAVAPLPGRPLETLEPRGDGPLLVCEDLEKPGNLGAVLRSADGAGAAGLVLVGRAPDLGNPNALRASLGTLFSVPLALATGDQALAWLRRRGYRLVATSPAAPACYSDADLRHPVALLLGSEKDGLSEQLQGAADLTVSIPMLGVADSLNLAQAATLLAYEVRRQRGRAPSR